MLSGPHLLQIAATTLAATVAVTTLAWLTLRAMRHSGIAARFTVALAGALLSIAVSSIAVSAQMYLSEHDLLVLGWVTGISATLSLLSAWALVRLMTRAAITPLVGAARRVGDGDVVEAPASGWRELDAVATELAAASQRLAEARATVAELDSARRQFFAWISHDLRTPLAGMRAMAEALEEGAAPDPQAYIRVIRDKVDTVTWLVDDLFRLSKLQTGTLDLRPEPVVLLDLISDAVADAQPAATARGVTISQDGAAGHIVWADPRELTRAIANLLSNGVRHAPDDTAIVMRVDALDGDRLVLSVIDQGPGVGSEDLGRMFDVGWRTDSSRTTGTDPFGSSGAGLGLAIVRGIVEAHGGSVGARRTDAGFQLDLVLPTGPRGAA